MQIRSILQASLVHGALIVGAGLVVRPFVVAEQPAVTMGVLLEVERPEVPREVEIVEPVVEEAVPEASFEEMPLPEAPFEDVAPPEPDEAAAVVEVEPAFAVPERVVPSEDWLLETRKTEPVPPQVQPELAPAAPAVAASRDAEALEHVNKKPDYPTLARRKQIEADVVLLVTVAVDGRVKDVELLESAGLTRVHKQMDRSAIAAICQWRYRPALRQGEPTEVRIRVPVRFRLR